MKSLSSFTLKFCEANGSAIKKALEARRVDFYSEGFDVMLEVSA
jgi:hypothetical protein